METTVAVQDDVEQILSEHLELLFRVGLQLTKDTARAERLVGETVQRVLRHPGIVATRFPKAALLGVLRAAFREESREWLDRPVWFRRGDAGADAPVIDMSWFEEEEPRRAVKCAC